MKSREPSRLAPRLRFPEFASLPGWPRTPLGAALKEHGLKSDGTSEVHSVSLGKGIVPQVEHMGRSFAASDTGHYSLVRPFDLVYTRSPLAIFKLGIVKQHKANHDALVSPLYGVFKPHNRHIGRIVEAFFDSPARSVRYLDPLAQKGAKNTIQLSNERFLSGHIYLPDNEDEQEKIADCLGSLDDLIAAEGRKLEALRQHKQGLMQQLFPLPERTENGVKLPAETVPRLRFPEFEEAGEWAVGRLEPCIDLISGVHLAPDAYATSGECPYFTGPSDFTNNREMVQKWSNESAAIAQHDDTLITVKGSGVGELWHLELDRVVIGRQLMAARPRSGSHSFLYYLLDTQRRRLEDLSLGNLIPGLSRPDILTLEVAMPGPPEQQRIGECLSVLDEQISVREVGLKNLRNHKCGLMQRLFPTPETP